MGARIPYYFSAHETRRTALVRQARAAAAASFAFRKLLVGRLNPCFFNSLWLFTTNAPFFPFLESSFVLKHRGTASAAFEPGAASADDKKIFASEIYIIDMLSRPPPRLFHIILAC
jgi:hypothetical protein